jgi:hypothetical protein
MPIASLKPTAPVPIIQNNEPQIQSQSYCSTTVDTQNKALSSLISYVQGMPWIVTYYRQVITTQSDLKEHDVGEVPVYQQYEKINNMEIRVTEAVAGEQNTNMAQMRVSGSALIYPFLTPQVGDTFVAEAGLGQMGIYTIDTTERKSFNLETVYSISYHLQTFVNTDQARLNDLNLKVIREFYFDKSRMAEGLNPILTTQQFSQLQSLSDLYKQIVSYYFNTFYDHNYDTLAVPGQGTGVYDAFLVDYVLRIVDTFDSLKIRNVRNYATDNEDFLAQPQFWSMMLQRDISMLPYINRYMGLVMIKFFNYNSMFKGLRYSRLSYVVYPVTADFSQLNPNTLQNIGDPLLMDYGVPEINFFAVSPAFKPQAQNQITEARSSGGSLVDLLAKATNTAQSGVQYINPILQSDRSYLLSSNFYEQTGTLTLMESCVTDYLNYRPLNLTNITSLAQQYKQWGRLEQFYYIPMLITLIKTAQVEACS